MELKHQDIYEGVTRVIFSPFNYHNSWSDKVWFSTLMSSLFSENSDMIIIATRENDFNVDASQLKSLRDKLPDIFKEGSYNVIEKWGKTRYSILGRTKFEEDHIWRLWKLYEFLVVFSLEKKEDFNDLLIKDKSLINFKNLKELLISEKCLFMLTKTDEDTELAVDCLSGSEILKGSLLSL